MRWPFCVPRMYHMPLIESEGSIIQLVLLSMTLPRQLPLDTDSKRQ